MLRFLARRGGALHSKGGLEICVSGLQLLFDDPDGDLGACVEVLVARAYEQRPEFVPGPDARVLDGGANVGLYAMAQAKRGAHVVAFEPHPLAYQRLQEHVSKNKLAHRIKCINAALGGATGVGYFHSSGKWHAAHLAEGAGPSIEEVQVLSLDDALEASGLDRVDILKLDIEGAEEDLLSSAGPSLDRVGALVLERHYPHDVRKTLAYRGLHLLPGGSDPNVEYYGRDVSKAAAALPVIGGV